MSTEQDITLASRIVTAAVRDGDLVRPETCEMCGDKPEPRTSRKRLKSGGFVTRTSIEAHHWNGHHNPLDVWFLCYACHNCLRGNKYHQGRVNKAEAKRIITKKRNLKIS